MNSQATSAHMSTLLGIVSAIASFFVQVMPILQGISIITACVASYYAISWYRRNRK